MNCTCRDEPLARREAVVLTVALTVLLLASRVWARPTTPYEAEMVVTGWLRSGFQPLGMTLGRHVMGVEAFPDDGGPVYYVVHLEPSGFVIVPAEDAVEPIVGFADDGIYDPSCENPLGALVTNDLEGRIAAARGAFTLHVALETDTTGRPENKWRDLIDRAENPANEYGLMGLVCVSDVRVIPLMQSQWGQTTVCGRDCYNYYVPKGYPCGCLATSMAQVMRYFRHPSAAIGVHEFRITVDERPQIARTRGGDGHGGPYLWDDMILRPEWNCGAVTEGQRQAIGALCHDAGIAVRTSYESDGAAAFLPDGREALVSTFLYSNAIMAYDSGGDISHHLEEILNPNLDAKMPVILAIINPDNPNSGHAVVCDGYGYESSTPYHHLNMGWEGIGDIWYNLPDINSAGGQFGSVFGCLYNIRTSGNGEIISGRILDQDGRPLVDVPVYAEVERRALHTAVTDSRGIYAIVGLDPNTTYTVWPEADGYVFSSRLVETGSSRDGVPFSGNRWGIDFDTEAVLEPPLPGLVYVDDDAPGDPRPDDPTRSDPQEDGSVEHPFDAIQEAIDAAEPGDIVMILDGTYSGDGNRDLDFKGKAIAVRSIDPNEPGLVIIDCRGSVNDPHRGFACRSYETPESVLDGLTVTGGYHEQGGGIYCKDCARPTIINCSFVRNSASLGGAVYNECAGPTIINCTFSDNSAEAGGGIYNYGELGTCSPILIDCVFSGNAAIYNGGAMYNLGQFAHPTLANCSFVGNSVSGGGGGALRNNLSAVTTLTNCLLIENSAVTFGGAIRCSNGSHLTLTNCTLGGNASGNGNALACTLDHGRLRTPCTVQIVNCILWNGGDEIYNKDDSTIIVTYSNVESDAGDGPWPGDGNIKTDPCFANLADGDYHLMSQAGRWDPKSQNWVFDKETSPCIDAGDASTPVGLEPPPNGGIINMGVYGGTAEASKSNSHP